MTTFDWLAGSGLVGCGVLYLCRPTLFRRGFWLKRSLAIRKLSPATYVRYMRALGLVYVLLGVAILAHGISVTPPR
jgi:hypothetical protein